MTLFEAFWIMSSPLINPVTPFAHWSTIVLTKAAGLTLRSSSPVDASLSAGATVEDDASSGSAVQLTDGCIMFVLVSLGL